MKQSLLIVGSTIISIMLLGCGEKKQTAHPEVEYKNDQSEIISNRIDNIKSDGMGRTGMLSECAVVTSLMSAYHKSQNEEEISEKLQKFALAIGKTAIDIGIRDGYTNDQVVLENRKNNDKYLGYMKNNMPFEQYSDMMQEKMKSCSTLLKSDSEITNSFRENTR